MMRKTAITEAALRELELYADGHKITHISKATGRLCNMQQLEATFFRIVNFGYEGIVPQNIMPKYSPEELCKKVNARANFADYLFNFHTPITKQEFLSESFLCGCREFSVPLGLDSDIRNLDLSIRTFNPLMRGFNNINSGSGYYYRNAKVPFTIRYLVQMTEKDLKKVRNLGLAGVIEINEELEKNGFKLELKKPSLNSVITGAVRGRVTTGLVGDSSVPNVLEPMSYKAGYER